MYPTAYLTIKVRHIRQYLISADPPREFQGPRANYKCRALAYN